MSRLTQIMPRVKVLTLAVQRGKTSAAHHGWGWASGAAEGGLCGGIRHKRSYIASASNGAGSCGGWEPNSGPAGLVMRRCRIGLSGCLAGQLRCVATCCACWQAVRRDGWREAVSRLAGWAIAAWAGHRKLAELEDVIEELELCAVGRAGSRHCEMCDGAVGSFLFSGVGCELGGCEGARVCRVRVER